MVSDDGYEYYTNETVGYYRCAGSSAGAVNGRVEFLKVRTLLVILMLNTKETSSRYGQSASRSRADAGHHRRWAVA